MFIIVQRRFTEVMGYPQGETIYTHPMKLEVAEELLKQYTNYVKNGVVYKHELQEVK